ncbi:MAG: Rieske 2Fe-2S domain-containing protein [Gammaproteobacteria bacterium]|nr:Rieske 2Fe-2S domain-containing protein [Gammaproteobacteria bacterium]
MEAECDELFIGDWFCVGRVEEVSKAGDFFNFDHVGEPVLVVHGRDGLIRAMSNLCRHRGKEVTGAIQVIASIPLLLSRGR